MNYKMMVVIVNSLKYLTLKGVSNYTFFCLHSLNINEMGF
jgi:hypothetical protein